MILICSIFWKIKGSFSTGIISIPVFFSFSSLICIEYSSICSSFLFAKIIKDCKCWHIFFGLILFEIMLSAFISCISRTASGSVMDSWTDSSCLFPIICIPSIYCILCGIWFSNDSINISFTGEGIFTSFHPILVEIICNSWASWSKFFCPNPFLIFRFLLMFTFNWFLVSFKLAIRLFNSSSFCNNISFNLCISSSYSSYIKLFGDTLTFLSSPKQQRLSTVEQYVSSFQISLITCFIS